MCLYLESVTGHACSILIDERLAIGRGVFGGGKQHALVSLGLFVFAYAAGLSFRIR